MEHLIDKILEISRLSREVDKEVKTCNLPTWPRWHILGFKEFHKVALELNKGEFDIEDTGASPYRYVLKFMYRGVEIFYLCHSKPKHIGNHVFVFDSKEDE